MVDRARKALADVPIHQETIGAWERAMEQVANVDRERVVAVEVHEDGNIKFEIAPRVQETTGMGERLGSLSEAQSDETLNRATRVPGT